MDLIELKKRLGMFLDHDEQKVEMYLEQFGAELNMKNIKLIREQEAQEAQEEEEPGENPLFTIKVQCPVCKNREIEAYELLAKSQVQTYDPFMMPIFYGAGEYRTVNYPKWAVTVCGKCYFASPDKKDFNVWNRSKNQFTSSQLGQGLLLELLETMGERQGIVEEFSIKGHPLRFPRPAEAAINSYRLALQRIKTEREFGINFSTFKQASYWLKIALIQRQYDIDYKNSLQEARLAMRDAYIRTDFPNAELEYQSTYVLSALELYFGDSKLCREYQASLDRTKSEIQNGIDTTGNLNACLKWIDKCKRLWDDRERSDIWDLPKAPEA